MIKEFSQIGWFDRGSRRFEYVDIKEDRMRRGQGEDGYIVPVFAIDQETASRLQVTLELAATTANSASDETLRRVVESAIDKVCGGADPIDIIRSLFPKLYVAGHRT